MDAFWKYLWVYAEREISNSKVAAEARSAVARKGHQTRADAFDDKKWERGDGFKSADEKWRAKVPILSALEQYTKKDLSKAEAVLSSIVSDLSEEGLRDTEVVSAKTKQRMAAKDAIIDSASSLVSKMTKVSKNMSLSSVRLLTGLCAMLAPQKQSDSAVSMRDFSDVLGINRNAKYVKE